MTSVCAFGAAFPEWRVSAEEVAEWTGGEASFVEQKVGIVSRSYLRRDESSLDLAVAAVRDLFARRDAPCTLPEIELLLVVTQNPEYRIPQDSSLLADQLGLPHAVASFDISLGCSGWVYGLSVARAMIASEGLRHALLVTCDPYSRCMRRSDRSTVTVFGDGAAATLVSADSAGAIGRADFGTDGSLGHHLMIRAGGAARPLVSLHGESELDLEEVSLHMDGRAIFEFMVSCVPDSVARCLEKNGLAKDEVDKFVFHQASGFMLKQLIRIMDLDPDKTPIDVAETGNTVSSSIPLVLRSLHGRGELRNKRVLVSGFGVGLSWATNVITFAN